jgi:hypothetical protein
MAIERVARAFACAAVLLLGTGCIGLAATLGQNQPQVRSQPVQSGQWRAPVRPAFAAVEVYSAPAQVNFDRTKLGSKRGSGGVVYIENPFFIRIPLASFGQLDARSIAQSAGITNVTHMDYRVINVLNIFVRFELIVYGD